MDKLDFCPNCGTKLDEDDEFCPNCGFDLKKYLSENATEPKTPVQKEPVAEKVETDEAESKPVESVTPTQPAAAPQNNRKKSNKWIPAIVILVILLIAGYFGGNMYYSEARQTQTLQDDVASGTTSRMKSALIDSNGQQISNSRVDALKRLYLKDTSAVKDIENQISNNSSKNIFSIKKSGKIMLFYPRYKVVMKDVSINVTTNITNPTFYVNNKVVAAKLVNGQYQIEKLTPGFYDLKVAGSKSSEHKTKQITIAAGYNQVDIVMNVTKPKKVEKTKVVKKTTKSNDDDTDTDSDNTDDDTDTNDDSDTDSDNDDTSDDSVIGQYTGDPDLSLYSDGTYDLGDKTGTYKIVENNNGHVKIQYNQDGGGSITESYDYSDGELHSTKYDQSWYKD